MFRSTGPAENSRIIPSWGDTLGETRLSASSLRSCYRIESKGSISDEKGNNQKDALQKRLYQTVPLRTKPVVPDPGKRSFRPSSARNFHPRPRDPVKGAKEYRSIRHSAAHILVRPVPSLVTIGSIEDTDISTIRGYTRAASRSRIGANLDIHSATIGIGWG